MALSRNFTNRNTTTVLASGIDNSTTTVAVSDGSEFPSTPFTIGVNDEVMLVTAQVTNTLTVTRAFGGTTAAAHEAGDTVRAVVVKEDLIEAEANLPLTLPSVSNGSPAYTFYPGGSLYYDSIATFPSKRGVCYPIVVPSEVTVDSVYISADAGSAAGDVDVAVYADAVDTFGVHKPSGSPVLTATFTNTTYGSLQHDIADTVLAPGIYWVFAHNKAASNMFLIAPSSRYTGVSFGIPNPPTWGWGAKEGNCHEWTNLTVSSPPDPFPSDMSSGMGGSFYPAQIWSYLAMVRFTIVRS